MCSVFFSVWMSNLKKREKEKEKREKRNVCIDMYLYLPITASLPATQRKKKVKLIRHAITH